MRSLHNRERMTTDWIEPERIGHQEIDRQRELLFKVAGEFMQINGLAERESCVNRLIEQFRMHFESEEALMRGIGLPEHNAHAHAQAHRQLISRLNRLAGRISNESLDLLELAAFMQQWTTVHIRKADAAWGEYFGSNSTTRPALEGEYPFAATGRIELPAQAKESSDPGSAASS